MRVVEQFITLDGKKGDYGLKQRIALVVNTLNQVEVHGAENMNKLLGSIQELERIFQDLPEEETGKEAKAEEKAE